MDIQPDKDGGTLAHETPQGSVPAFAEVVLSRVWRVISSLLSYISAFVLFVAGCVLLFAPDVMLPAVAPGFPPAAAWLGQLLAAAWLGVATSTWLQRKAVLGGVYGRPTVLANLALYFITALSLLRALLGHAAPPVLWVAVVIAGVLAAGYGALLLRGPFGSPGQPAN